MKSLTNHCGRAFFGYTRRTRSTQARKNVVDAASIEKVDPLPPDTRIQEFLLSVRHADAAFYRTQIRIDEAL